MRKALAAELQAPGQLARGRAQRRREHLAILAGQLLSLSMEREADVIVLSEIDYSGLERFGFRSERICGETEAAREACEYQVSRLWNPEIVLQAQPLRAEEPSPPPPDGRMRDVAPDLEPGAGPQFYGNSVAARHDSVTLGCEKICVAIKRVAPGNRRSG